jgi:hypothetical protein
MRFLEKGDRFLTIRRGTNVKAGAARNHCGEFSNRFIVVDDEDRFFSVGHESWENSTKNAKS